MKPTFFATPETWGRWLEAHHADTVELLVGFYKRDSGRPSITWPESVDEALCYGWIDGVRRRVDDLRCTIRFTPRRRGTWWARRPVGGESRKRTYRSEQGGENSLTRASAPVPTNVNVTI